MKKIKYISYFDFQDSPVKRGYVTSATNKIESICQALHSLDYAVDIVSMAPVIAPNFKFYKGIKIKRYPWLSLTLFPSWGGNGKVLRSIRVLWHLMCMLCYLLLNTKKDEPIIVYHSQGYFDIIRWAKKVRRFKLILEVEEIYDDVASARFKAMSNAEQRMFAEADAYIFPTTQLDYIINNRNLPSVIIHGSYNVEPQISERFSDGKIHVVYAGTFDPRKGGVAAAVAAAVFLPKQYHVHICGFGSENDTENLKNLIVQTQKISKAAITFEGLKTGEDYIRFIQKCHIGLSTQNPSAAFNATSFPSKILSYMANGLSVVSIDIPVVSEAEIAPYINFYMKQTPENLAKAIINTNVDNDNRSIVKALYSEFIRDLGLLMNKI